MTEKMDIENKPPRRIRKKVYKMIIRRLPIALTEEELLQKLSPLPTHERLWFRKGETYLEDDAFPYAFIVFDDFDEASNFQKTYNGQTFTDSENNESTVIVEKAANQDYSKEPIKPKAGVKPITEDIGFIQFLEEAEAKSITKKVDFDVLVNEITERERRLAKGICQETPLTDYFVKRAHEKVIKSRPKPKPSKLDKAETKPSTKIFGKDKKEKPARVSREAKPKPVEKELRPKEFDKKKRERPPRKEYSKQNSKDSESLPSTSASQKRVIDILKEEALKEQARTKDESTTTIASTANQDEKSKETKPIGPPKRNKDRPERAIYQPAKARR